MFSVVLTQVSNRGRPFPLRICHVLRHSKRFVFSLAPRWDGSQKPADVETRSLAALLICLHLQGEQMDAPRSPRPTVIQRAWLRSQPKCLPGCWREKDATVSAGGDNGQAEGLGGF